MTEAEQTSQPLGLASTDGLGVAVGDAVMLRADLYEPPDEYAPGGYLASKGEKLIVRKVEAGRLPISVSHEGRTDGTTFGVAPDEIEPWHE